MIGFIVGLLVVVASIAIIYLIGFISAKYILKEPIKILDGVDIFLNGFLFIGTIGTIILIIKLISILGNFIIS